MAKGFTGGGFGGGNMGQLMKQAQKMQKDIEKAKAELAEKTVEATVGGGAVTVVATCNKEIREITIKPEVIDPDDAEMLQDLVVAAVNEALRMAEETSQADLSKYTGGLGGMHGLF